MKELVNIDYSLPFEFVELYKRKNTEIKARICINWGDISYIREFPLVEEDSWNDYRNDPKVLIHFYTYDEAVIVGKYKEVIKYWKEYKKWIKANND